jgi:hypothetical protein
MVPVVSTYNVKYFKVSQDAFDNRLFYINAGVVSFYIIIRNSTNMHI